MPVINIRTNSRMASWGWRDVAVLKSTYYSSKDPRSVHSTYVKQLRASCNSNSKDPKSSSSICEHLYSLAHIHIIKKIYKQTWKDRHGCLCLYPKYLGNIEGGSGVQDWLQLHTKFEATLGCCNMGPFLRKKKTFK